MFKKKGHSIKGTELQKDMSHIETKIKMVAINPTISIITLNVNGLYKTIESQRL